MFVKWKRSKDGEQKKPFKREYTMPTGGAYNKLDLRFRQMQKSTNGLSAARHPHTQAQH